MKYLILAASVLIQVCLGGLYAWSSFVPALHDAYDLSFAQTQVIFGGLIAVFTLAMVPAGRLLNRVGPQVIAGIGGLLFGAGYLLASYSGGSFWVLLAGVGLLAGLGTGMGYVCPLAMCAKWFPRRKGLVTGLAVAGFGGGAVLLSSLAEVLFARGLGVLEIFRWVGIAYGGAILLSALVLHAPQGSAFASRRNHPAFAVLLRDPVFWALVAGIFCGTFAGLLVIGNLKPMVLAAGAGAARATAAISAFAVGNAAGRITWGWLSDRLGSRSVPLSLALLALMVAGLWMVRDSAEGLISMSMPIGFGFGACFVVYAAQVGSRYGAERVAAVYPLVFLAYGASGIAGPWMGGWLKDTSGSYAPALGVSLAVVAAGLLASLLLLRRPAAMAEIRAEAPSRA
jgi:OFA family oxalate/formate antiporter-like MFS transporter